MRKGGVQGTSQASTGGVRAAAGPGSISKLPGFLQSSIYRGLIAGVAPYMFDFLFGYPVLSLAAHSSTKQHEPVLAGPCLFSQSLIKAWPSQRAFDLTGCSRMASVPEWAREVQPRPSASAHAYYGKLLLPVSEADSPVLSQIYERWLTQSDRTRHRSPCLRFARMNGRSAS